jgi:pimeloyl-ACP methyl ester carboxylesterase
MRYFAKFLKKAGLVLLFVIVGWLFYAQFAMQYRKPDVSAIRQFQKAGVKLETKTVELNGFRLHYVKTGDDTLPTLFFVHGSPGGWIRFEEYLKDKDLLKKFRMISVDRPGYGYSQYGDVQTLQEQSDILSMLIKSMQNGKPWFAAGRSYGGPMITKLAIDNPGFFSGLVLIAAALDPSAEKPEKWRPIMKRAPFKYFLPGAWRQSNAELWQLKKELVPLSQRLGEVTCNVIVLHGDRDGLVPVSNAEFIRQKFIHAKSVSVTIIPGANHFVSDHHFGLVKKTLLSLY